MHQVGFTETDTAVNEQWVIGAAGVFTDLHGGRPCQLIGFAGDKRVKGKVRVEITFMLCWKGFGDTAGETGTQRCFRQGRFFTAADDQL